ncbi:unnamed protein product, partial [Amoebophrya sp. A120]
KQQKQQNKNNNRDYQQEPQSTPAVAPRTVGGEFQKNRDNPFRDFHATHGGTSVMERECQMRHLLVSTNSSRLVGHFQSKEFHEQKSDRGSTRKGKKRNNGASTADGKSSIASSENTKSRKRKTGGSSAGDRGSSCADSYSAPALQKQAEMMQQQLEQMHKTSAAGDDPGTTMKDLINSELLSSTASSSGNDESCDARDRYSTLDQSILEYMERHARIQSAKQGTSNSVESDIYKKIENTLKQQRLMEEQVQTDGTKTRG